MRAWDGCRQVDVCPAGVRGVGMGYVENTIRKETPMDISLIIKVAGVGILVSVAAQILSKAGRDEQSMLVTLAGIVVVLLLLVDEIALLFDRICAVFGF